jgi:hypothetical protein
MCNEFKTKELSDCSSEGSFEEMELNTVTVIAQRTVLTKGQLFQILEAENESISDESIVTLET